MDDKITRLSQMRNLGLRSERYLMEVGVETPEALQALGAVETWLRLKMTFGRSISLVFLYALEGALTDQDWRHLPSEVKARVKAEAKCL
jgi:DNA transformation protein and related proteins